MNKNTKKAFALGFAGLTALTASAAVVSAYTGNNKVFQQQGNLNSEDIQSAITNNDYTTFSELVDKEITEDQFDMIVIRHEERESVQNAIDSEDYDAFVEALTDAERPVPSEEQFEEMVQRHQAHDKIEQAIESGNYNVWLSAVEDLPHGEDMANIISEDEFSLLVEMHELRADGLHEEARDIAEELGIDQIMPRDKGMGGHEEGPGNRERVGDGDGPHARNNEAQGMMKGMGIRFID